MDTTTTRGLELPSIENSWGFKGKNYLFTIGVDRYQHWPPLKCAVKDTHDFADIVTDRYQFEEKNVITLTNKEATEKNILSGFKKLIQDITDEDNLVIYFSGHGHYDEVTDTGYWIPVNAHMGDDYEYEFINTTIIVDRIKKINSLHTFLIVDACFSGTLITQVRSSPRSERYKSRRVFTSGRDEVVNDGPEGGNSPFASGLLTYLKNNTDKYISASELILDVREYVEKESQQTPMEGRIINANDQGGDFVFYLKMSEAEIWASTVDQHNQEGYKKFMDQFPQSEHRKDAQEAYDWLTAQEDSSIRSYQGYLNKYRQRDGKYVPQAIKNLKAIEAEQCWNRAKSQNTIYAYNNYLFKFPEGKYAEEAKNKIGFMTGDEDDQKFKEALEKDTPEAYEDYINTPEAKKYKEQAERKLDPETSSIEEPDEEEAWTTAKNAGTYIAYLNFTRSYPESRFVDEAAREMKRLDNIAMNQIRLAEQNRSLSLQDKIEECLKYFNSYPGADNNKLVKKIKDRLQIQRYSKEHN